MIVHAKVILSSGSAIAYIFMFSTVMPSSFMSGELKLQTALVDLRSFANDDE